MRDPTELNISDAGRAGGRPPPSDEEVTRFQREFGVGLPPEYLTLLRTANGGHPELDVFFTQGAGGAHDWGVDLFFHLSSDEYDHDSLWRAMREYGAVLGAGCVPVARDGGGNIVYVDTKATTASVWLWVHDEDLRLPVAPTFAAFIDSLRTDPDLV